MPIYTSDGETYEDELYLAHGVKTEEKPITNAPPEAGKEPTQSDKDSMTHQPEQTNPALPYMQKFLDFLDTTPKLERETGETWYQGMFGGRMSPAAVKFAEQMEARGMSAVTTKEITNLERGAEGRWRSEFSDHDSKLRDIKNLPTTSFGSRFGTVGEILDHPTLYKIYPEAKDIDIMIAPGMKDMGGAAVKGLYSPEFKTIGLNEDLTPEQMRSTLHHEIQHWIQDKEGFALDSPSSFSTEFRDQMKRHYLSQRMPTLEKIIGHAEKGNLNTAREYAAQLLSDIEHRFYRSQASEVEARNTQNRLKMNELERRKSLATRTEDVHRDEQIIGSK